MAQANSKSKVMDLRALMAGHQEDEPAKEPAPGLAVVSVVDTEPVVVSAEDTPAGQEPEPDPEQGQGTDETLADTVETQGKGGGETQPEPEAPDQVPPTVENTDTTKKPAPKKTARKKTTPKKADPQPAEPDPTDMPEPADLSGLVSVDGRPGRLWDTSSGRPLPAGWGREALRRVALNSRAAQSEWRKGNPMLPEPVHQDLLGWILEEAVSTGEQYSVSQILEAALEQIPDDVPGCQVMLDELPEEYLSPNVIRPRGSRLRVDTIRRLGLLPLQLRAAGLNRHAGRVHTVAVIRLLDDLRAGPAEDG